jgi:drug/metabolite transporter (DMT)-like permease
VKSRAGFLFAILAATLFGVGGTFAQFLFRERGVNIDWLVTMRLLCAGSVLLLVAAARQGRAVLAPWRGQGGALVLFGPCGMLSVQYTYMAAIDQSNTATATVLQFTAPSMIAVWVAARHRRMPTRRELAAIFLALLGTWLLVTHGKLGALSISPLALFWGIASAVAAAFNSLQPVALLKKHGASVIGGWGMLIGGVALSFLHPPWAVTGTWDTKGLIFLAFIISFGTLAAFYLYIKAVHMIGAQKTSLLSCAEPLSAAALAVWWLGVSFGGMDWLGTACILATIVLLAREQSEESQSEKVT